MWTQTLIVTDVLPMWQLAPAFSILCISLSFIKLDVEVCKCEWMGQDLWKLWIHHPSCNSGCFVSLLSSLSLSLFLSPHCLDFGKNGMFVSGLHFSLPRLASKHLCWKVMEEGLGGHWGLSSSVCFSDGVGGKAAAKFIPSFIHSYARHRASAFFYF